MSKEKYGENAEAVTLKYHICGDSLNWVLKSGRKSLLGLTEIIYMIIVSMCV